MAFTEIERKSVVINSGQEDLRNELVKQALFVFDLIQKDDKMDAADVPTGIYALYLHPTKAMLLKTTGTDQRGEKFFTFDEFWEMYLMLRDNKDQGHFRDFVECFKVFDSKENGTMKLREFTDLLRNVGEIVTEKELKGILDDCLFEEENEDGEFPYMPFLCRLCDEAVPQGFKPGKVSLLKYSY